MTSPTIKISIPGLPPPGSHITVLITRINLNPTCVLVELWGNLSQERKADHQYLQQSIQSPQNLFCEFEGNPGDQCLVQVDTTWYRSRIVSRNGSNYRVFLIDKGWMLGTTTSMLAWSEKEHFKLPPQVEFCVLSNVLPLSTENRWSAMALEFLKTLSGRSMNAFVQDVLVPDRTFLLHIPCIEKQMHEMGFSRKLSPEKFKDYVYKSLHYDRGETMFTEHWTVPTGNKPLDMREPIEKRQTFMYPELPKGTVETVIITEVTNPLRVFCQLKVFSQELKKLTEQITQHYDCRAISGFVGPLMLGSPCAARGSDGRWCRSVLQRVVPTNSVVEVLNVDYGKKQFVHMDNVKPLASEFFRMPVVTYVTSLHGIIDNGVGWTANQISYLKSLLLYKTVIAKFEYQSLSEGVHYVTLYCDENQNINAMFDSYERSQLECEKSCGGYAICSYSSKPKNEAQRESQTSTKAVDGTKGKGIGGRLPVDDDLPLNSSVVAVVYHVSTPSEFWIQTQKYAIDFGLLLGGISEYYRNSENQDIVRCPAVGLYCAAKAPDGVFYRSIVSEVSETKIKVFYVDYGNTEVIERSSIRALPEMFKTLPRLALKCKLAGVKPKNDSWSVKDIEFFSRSVMDKLLTVQVISKCEDCYVVRLIDSIARRESDVSRLMCSSGFAETGQQQIELKCKVAIPNPKIPVVLNPGTTSHEAYESSNISISVNPKMNESRPIFQEHMFPLGSALDVNVSYLQSPNSFWCQLVQSAGHLKLLMQDMQTFYAGSQYQPFVETACVACHPDNGMWYRAIVIKKHVTAFVDVLFVDYGQMETVSLYDLRRISQPFLNLKGQAFRCSLYNPFEPTSLMKDWDKRAIAQFQDFVETAASSHIILKCTIYSIMYNEQKGVFNIVDLQTPFESVCTRMVQLVNNAPAKEVSGSSFRLDTYCYSSHNIKRGTEELITVTSVHGINHFYCQLDRNTDVLEDLTLKLHSMCDTLKNAKLPTTFGALCFAKYTDDLWYRGQIKATQPSILVHFVDYGNTIEVDKTDLLPIPKEASDIMSVPVQAVECGLIDVPANVSSEGNDWFKTNATNQSFRALVVAKEQSGKLLVELYYRKTQVNLKIKNMHLLEDKTPNIYQARTSFEDSSHAQHASKAALLCATVVGDDAHASAPKPLSTIGVKTKKAKSQPSQIYKTPHQRQLARGTPRSVRSGSDAVESHSTEPVKWIMSTESNYTSKLHGAGCQTSKVILEPEMEPLPKLTDLPPKSITPGTEADVFVSYCDSPLSFYVQLAREENDLLSVVEQLNNSHSTVKSINLKALHPGDLVQAVFPEDLSWYRAVLRGIQGNGLVRVEFVDFGNTATVSISQIGRLHKRFLQLPVYSTHCLLSEAADLGKEMTLNPEVVSTFKKDVLSKLKCTFLKNLGSVWEVSLEYCGMKVLCKMPTNQSGFPDATPEKNAQIKEKPSQTHITREMPPEKPSLKPLCYHKAHISEGQKFDVYVTSIASPKSFWCHSTSTDDINKITTYLSEEGHAVHHVPVDASLLSHGSPCIALFADKQWYRGEVISRDGDMLSIHFVDYGNCSQVNIRDVRQISSGLVEIPTQAFLCELDGFDDVNRCWENGTVNCLSELITDKLLQLSVLRVARKDGTLRYIVQVECEGNNINEMMRAYWKSSKNKSNTDATELSGSHKLLLCDGAMPQSHLQEEPEDAIAAEINMVIGSVESKSDNSDERWTHELSELTFMPENSASSEAPVQPESLASIQNEVMDQILVEVDETNKPQPATWLKSWTELVSSQVVEVVSEAHTNDNVHQPWSDDLDNNQIEQCSTNGHGEQGSCTSDEDKEQTVGPNTHHLDDVHEEVEGPTTDQIQKKYDGVPQICIDALAEGAERSPAMSDKLETREGCIPLREAEPETAATQLEFLLKVRNAHNEEGDTALHSDFEVGQLRPAAEVLPVGSPCVLWSPALLRWCKAMILKNLKDCSVAQLVDYDIEMMVDPESIFVTVSLDSEQTPTDDSATSFEESLDLVEQSDCEDTLAGVGEMLQDESALLFMLLQNCNAAHSAEWGEGINVASQEETAIPLAQKKKLPVGEESPYCEEEHSALGADVELGDTAHPQETDNVAETTEAFSAEQFTVVHLERGHGAESLTRDHRSDQAPIPYTDLKDAPIKERPSNPDDGLEAQLTSVSHLFLVVKDCSHRAAFQAEQ